MFLLNDQYRHKKREFEKKGKYIGIFTNLKHFFLNTLFKNILLNMQKLWFKEFNTYMYLHLFEMKKHYNISLYFDGRFHSLLEFPCCWSWFFSIWRILVNIFSSNLQLLRNCSLFLMILHEETVKLLIIEKKKYEQSCNSNFNIHHYMYNVHVLKS